MQSEVEIYTLLSREQIKAERKVRNKIKRENQKLEKLNKTIIGKNHGISIVSNEFVTEYKSKEECLRVSSNHQVPINANNPPYDCVSTRTVNLEDLIRAKKQPRDTTKSKAVIADKYIGNRLDSAQPIRLVGKHREVPKKKTLSGLRKNLIEEQTASLIGLKSFNYCNNILNDELNTAAHTFINEVVILQEKLFKRDPNKGVGKRRYVVGFRETKKKMVVNKVKICIIAVDINVRQPNDALHKAIFGITEVADDKKIPYVFALKRRTIANLAMKSMPISCMGVLNYDGANESFKSLMEQVSLAKQLHTGLANTISDENVVVNNTLLEALKGAIIS